MRYTLEKSCHSVYGLYYHLVLVVKYRRKVLSFEIIERLKDIIHSVAIDFDVKIIEQEGDKDHMHILFSCKPTFTVTKFINSLKGVTSRLIQKEFPEVHEKLWKGHFWSPSYCLLTTGQVSLDVLKTYIEDQSDGKNI